MAAACVPAFAAPADALEKTTLQLKWKHQFQFAGYYAALEKGFYRDAGLDVEIREGGPQVDASVAIASGQADFGVCTSSALLGRAKGQELVVLAVIFQHSAAVLLVPSRAAVNTLPEIKGRPLMDTPGSDELAAMLKREGIDYATDFARIDHRGDPSDLINGKADVMVAYSTNEPFVLDQLGAPYQMFAPRTYGIDFFGDSLCTSEKLVAAYPERIQKMRAATIKGWQYALANKEEVVDLILDRYSRAKPREALIFEANQTESLVRPKLIEIGHQSPERWANIANTYFDLGMLKDARVPAGMIYGAESEDKKILAYRLLLGVVGLALLAIIGRWSVRTVGRHLSANPSLKLSAVMAALFICLSLPILIFILLYNYRTNSRQIESTLESAIERTRRINIESLGELIQPVASTLQLVAGTASADPELFRVENSRDYLYRALTSAPQIDAIYVSYEDGYHRVVTRIDEDRRRSDPKIPPTANWHSSYIDDFSFGTRRSRHRTFFDVWPKAVGGYSTPATVDIRKLKGYQAAKVSGGVVVTPPDINPDTGYPIISVRYPIYSGGTFFGCASANITLNILSRHLALNRASPRSVSIVVNPFDGTIIAHSDFRKTVRKTADRIEIAKIDTIDDGDTREAYRKYLETNEENFTFRSPASGEQVIASFTRFPRSFGHPWQIIILTPIDDFVGILKTANRQMIFIIIALTSIELFLIYFFASRLSRPIESVSEQLESAERFSFQRKLPRSTWIGEVAKLQSAANLLHSSLRSFASFVPTDLVRHLIKSGGPLVPGVELRPLTIMFTDLEGFSTLAEKIPPGDLIHQMTAYFEAVTRAVADEGGTVDKFIGDGIMSFWGAPESRPDHILRACAGAVRAARRMENLNKMWREEGRQPIHMRAGLHTGDVLVGNIGSSQRLSYTAIGDGVNVAARMENINKYFGTTICISDSVHKAVPDLILARPIKKVRVKGRAQLFMIYELLALRTTDDAELRPRPGEDRLCELTEVASALFEQDRASEAAQRYRDILVEFPDDPLAKAMLGECEGGKSSGSLAQGG